MNFSLTNMNATDDYLDYNNSTKYIYGCQIMSYYSESINFSVIFIICCIGLPLNGIVIWLLGFQIKINRFTVLILNLAIADFGFLLFMVMYGTDFYTHIIQPGIPWEIFFSLFSVTYISGLFLLTAISIDRCVAVLFPMWHRCSRPKYLSSAVCVFLWICSFLLIGIHYTMENLFLSDAIWNLHLVVTALICLPLIIISTLILFIKICLKSNQIKRGRLLVIILITLLCFLILTLPLDIYVFVILKKNIFFGFNELDYCFTLSASLNSSVNPVIYFLVGKKKRAQMGESIKVIFQRVFREDKVPEI